MRLAVLVALLSVAVAGCLGGAGPGPAGPTLNGTENPDRDVDGAAAPNGTSTPDLADGTSFTYRGEGLYNLDGTFTVVVRERDDGYLFAGAGPGDLVEEVMWDRVWFGRQDEDLDPVADEGSPARLFDFPLTHNKTWRWADREDWPVVARRAEVPVPGGGTEDGFEMTMATGADHEWMWTYAPSVGYVTRLTSADADVTYYDLALTDVGTVEDATWFDPVTAAEGVCAGGTTPPEQGRLSVSGADAVVVSTGFAGNGSAAVQPPPTSQEGPTAWTHTGPDATWDYARVEAADGDWTLGAASPDRYACIVARAVTWLEV